MAHAASAHWSRTYASGLDRPEGPAFLPTGELLVVEMGRETRAVTLIDPTGGLRVLRRTGGFPQGICLDRDGAVWVAEAHEHAVLKLAPDGTELGRVETADGLDLLWPNDLAVGMDGAIYVTDSGARYQDLLGPQGMREDYRKESLNGRVYRVDRVTLTASVLDAGLMFGNGIAVDGQGRVYANDTFSGVVYRYTPGAAGQVTREEFARTKGDSPIAEPGGPDGMKFGADGRLYCAMFRQGHLAVVAPDGSVAERITTRGPAPTNIAFGLHGEPRAYVTDMALGTVDVYMMPCGGAALYT
jgi:gluconolactonase